MYRNSFTFSSRPSNARSVYSWISSLHLFHVCERSLESKSNPPGGSNCVMRLCVAARALSPPDAWLAYRAFLSNFRHHETNLKHHRIARKIFYSQESTWSESENWHCHRLRHSRSYDLIWLSTGLLLQGEHFCGRSLTIPSPCAWQNVTGKDLFLKMTMEHGKNP